MAWDVKSKSDPGVRVALWHGEDKLPDVVLHGPSGPRVTGIALEPPFIIFSLKGDPSARHREGCSWISVYKMDPDNLGDNSSTKVELVKAIPIDGFNCTEMSQVNRLLSNDLVLCFVQNQEEDMDNIVHVFDKARLLNEDIAAEREAATAAQSGNQGSASSPQGSYASPAGGAQPAYEAGRSGRNQRGNGRK